MGKDDLRKERWLEHGVSGIGTPSDHALETSRDHWHMKENVYDRKGRASVTRGRFKRSYSNAELSYARRCTFSSDLAHPKDTVTAEKTDRLLYAPPASLTRELRPWVRARNYLFLGHCQVT